MDVEIREATIADYAEVSALWGETDAFHHAALPQVFASPAEPARTLETTAAILADLEQGLLVAQAESRVVGVAHLILRVRRPPMVPKRFVVVDAIGVSAGYRGSGVGRQLMEAAERWGRERGAVEAWLDVWEFNEAAIGFYEVLGYTTLSRRMRKTLDG